jgi:hypothetical protein
MRQVDNKELAQIIIDGRGYVLNERPETRTVHHASCEAVGAMVASAYPKYFSEDKASSNQWLDEKFPSGRWKNCTYCFGLYKKL